MIYLHVLTVGLAGAVTVKHWELTHEVAKVQKLIGAPLAPLESFLLARGLRTLHVRMQRHPHDSRRREGKLQQSRRQHFRTDYYYERFSATRAAISTGSKRPRTSLSDF